MFRDPEAINADLSVTLTGFSNSEDFPFPSNSSPRTDQSCNCPNEATDAIVVCLNNDTTLRWSTFLGGGASEIGLGVAIDRRGRPMVGGWTTSRNFPKSPFQQLKGGRDAFVSGFESLDGARILSELVGGTDDDLIEDLIVIADNAVLAVGTTESSDLNTRNAFQDTYGGGPSDGMIVRIDPNKTGSKLREISFLGGSALDQIRAITETGLVVHLAGNTSSPDFPLLDPIQPAFAGGETDAWLSRFGTQIQAFNGLLTLQNEFSTLLGGSEADGLTAIASSPSPETPNGIALVGASNSPNLIGSTTAPETPPLGIEDSWLLGILEPTPNPFDISIEAFGNPEIIYETIFEKPALRVEFELLNETPEADPEEFSDITLTISHGGPPLEVRFFSEALSDTDPNEVIRTPITDGITCTTPNPVTTACTIASETFLENRNRIIVRVSDAIQPGPETVIVASIEGDGDDPNQPNNIAATGYEQGDVEVIELQSSYRTILDANGNPAIEVTTRFQVRNNGPNDTFSIPVIIFGSGSTDDLEIQQVEVLPSSTASVFGCSPETDDSVTPPITTFSCSILSLMADTFADLEVKSILHPQPDGSYPFGTSLSVVAPLQEMLIDSLPRNNSKFYSPPNAEDPEFPDLGGPGDQGNVAVDVSIEVLESSLQAATTRRTTTFLVTNNSTILFAANTQVTIPRDFRVLSRTATFKRFSPFVISPDEPVDCNLSISNVSCNLGTLTPGEIVSIEVIDELSALDEPKLVEIEALVTHDTRDPNLVNNHIRSILKTGPDVAVEPPDIDIIQIGQDPNKPEFAIRTRICIRNLSAFAPVINADLIINSSGDLDFVDGPATLVEGTGSVVCHDADDGDKTCTINRLEPQEKVTIEFIRPIPDRVSSPSVYAISITSVLDDDINPGNDGERRELTYRGVADVSLSLISCEELDLETADGTERVLRSLVRVENDGPITAEEIVIESLADLNLSPAIEFKFLPVIDPIDTTGNTIHSLAPNEEVIFQTTIAIPDGVRVLRRNLGARIASSLINDSNPENNRVDAICAAIAFSGTKIRQSTTTSSPQVVITFPSTATDTYIIETTPNLSTEFTA
jgi:hypothetical protein